MGLEREDLLIAALLTIAGSAAVLVILLCGYCCYNMCEMPDLRGGCCDCLAYHPRAVNIYNPAAQLPPTLPAPTHSAVASFVQQNPIRSFP